MSYFANCRKCGKEIPNEDFRFQLPNDGGYICSDCTEELSHEIDKWIEKTQIERDTKQNTDRP
jgi:hypothetical protein